MQKVMRKDDCAVVAYIVRPGHILYSEAVKSGAMA